MAFAKTFLEAIQAPFAQEEFKDTYREELQQLIESNRLSQQVAATTPATDTRQPAVDILEALKKSIELMRKPPTAQTKPTPRKTAERATPTKDHARRKVR